MLAFARWQGSEEAPRPEGQPGAQKSALSEGAAAGLHRVRASLRGGTATPTGEARRDWHPALASVWLSHNQRSLLASWPPREVIFLFPLNHLVSWTRLSRGHALGRARKKKKKWLNGKGVVRDSRSQPAQAEIDVGWRRCDADSGGSGSLGTRQVKAGRRAWRCWTLPSGSRRPLAATGAARAAETMPLHSGAPGCAAVLRLTRAGPASGSLVPR